MNRKQWIVMIMVSATSLLFTGCKRSTPEEVVQMIVNRTADRLDLDDTQKSKLEVVGKQVLAMRESAKQFTLGNKDSILRDIRSAHLDEAAVSDRIRNRRALIDSQIPDLVKVMADFHASLSQEQKELVAERLEKLFALLDP